MLRYRLARPWLLGRRLLRGIAGDGGPGFRILLFHDVPDERLAAFARLVAEVKRTHGVLTPAEAEGWLADGPPPGRSPGRGRRPCLFSFDDGFASNRGLAETVLAGHGIRALFFVCPGLIELPADQQPARIAADVFEGRIAAAALPRGLRLMSWAELAQLKAAGHTIGAHGLTHRRLDRLAGEALRREIVEAGDRLEGRLGAPVTWFAYPFGSVECISKAALEVIAARYRFCRSGVRGLNVRGTDRRALRADHLDLAAPPAYQALAVDGGLDFRYRAARRRLDSMVAP